MKAQKITKNLTNLLKELDCIAKEYEQAEAEKPTARRNREYDSATLTQQASCIIMFERLDEVIREIDQLSINCNFQSVKKYHVIIAKEF